MNAMREWIVLRKETLICGLLTFLGIYGVCYLGTIAGLGHGAYSVLGIPVGLVIWFALSWVKNRILSGQAREGGRRTIVFAALVSYLFSLSMVMGYQLQNTGITAYGYVGKLLILLRSACLSVAFFPLAYAFFELAGNKIPQTGIRRELFAGKNRKLSPKIFWITTGIVFLCLVPVWLAYYPLIMSYDFHRQVNEAAKGFAYFFPYQPIAHTWVIWVFYQLGRTLGSLQTGMACMALFQMALYSLVVGYAVAFLQRIWKSKALMVGMILYFGVFPFNTVHVLCSTKDVLFSILFLLFFLLLLERSFFAGGKKRLVVDVLLVLEGCLMMQFRNNAFYAVAVFMVCLLLFCRKREKLRILILCVLLILGGRVTKAVIREAIGTQIPDQKIEMYSVPIQQFARVGYYHQETLDPDTAALVGYYVDRDRWKFYNPPLADTIKGTVRHESYLEDTGDFLKDWICLGLKFPNEYIDAFLELTRGYWFLDDLSWAENLGYGEEGRMGSIFTYNSAMLESGEDIVHESKLPWLEALLEKLVSGNCFYDWPIISVVFKSAFYAWALFLAMMVMWYKKQWEQLKLVLFPFLYFATMLLGPVVQIRYVFPVMVTLPLVIAMVFWKVERGRGMSSKYQKGT